MLEFFLIGGLPLTTQKLFAHVRAAAAPFDVTDYDAGCTALEGRRLNEVSLAFAQSWSVPAASATS